MSWEPNRYTTMTRKHLIGFAAGETVTADLTVPQKDRTGKEQIDEIVVVYEATPPKIVDAMCKMAKITKDDVVYDLGCGDGRMVITAVKKFGAKRGVGIDIDPYRVKQSKENAKAAGVTDKVDFRVGDIMKINDLSEATVVLLFIGEDLNKRLRPIFEKTLPSGARIVSHYFRCGDWEPADSESFRGDGGGEHPVHMWRIEKKK